MEYSETTPETPLARFVNRAWFLSHTPAHRQEKILPLPVHHFILNLADEPYRVLQQGEEARSLRFAGGFVSGIQATYLVIENPAHIRHVGVEFKPHGLSAFTNLPSKAYVGIVQSSEPILPDSTSLAQELRQTSDPQQLMQALLTFLAQRLRPEYQPPDYLDASRALLETIPSVAEVARNVGVSHKQLAQQWRRYTGITPKQYQNIVRLQQVIAWFDQAERPIRWSSLVSELPFSDQPYMIRTFRHLTGFTPREYAATLARFASGENSFVALDEAYTG